LQRTSLVNYRGHALTEDTAKALHALEERAGKMGKWKLELFKAPVDNPMVKAGREIHLRLRRSDATHQECLNAAWGFCVPLGFTPNDRWPRASQTDAVFYYLGPWQSLNDRLLAEGRGHLAWSSMCAAALVDVGRWEGDREAERFVQAQLHRIGKGVGPVDGVVGRRTQAGLESLGLHRPTLAASVNHLMNLDVLPQEAARKKAQKSQVGHLSIPNHRVRVQAFGAVTAQQHGETSAFITASGEGRLVVEVSKDESSTTVPA